jgi:primosomal protein N' (replication factor Y)
LIVAGAWGSFSTMNDDSRHIKTKKPLAKQVVSVVLPFALAGAYSYMVPTGMAVAAGDYVNVPLGPRKVVGVVWQVDVAAPEGMRLRAIAEKFDLPPMSDVQRKFIDWISAYYLSPVGMVLRGCLRAKGIFEPPRMKIAYRLTGREPSRMTPQRQRVIETARDLPVMKARELADEAGVGVSVVKGLVEQRVFEAVDLPPFAPFAKPDPMGLRVVLSPSQETAARQLRQMITSRRFAVSLLDGVTGSGKTEVYFEAMAAAVAAGKQVILLLPEIALTNTFIVRVEERFAAPPAEWHSQMRPRERERVWRAVASGEAKIVVGARSALFLPWQNLGLIVVDEEHEAAYKQGDGTSYHARDMAVVYGSLGKFAIVLASATPSLESLVNVDHGKYHHVTLKNRHGRAELPEISLLDMRANPPASGQWLSDRLAAAVRETLEAGDQALLFLNRRGYAPLTLCRTCGHRLQCDECSSWLVEHRFRKQLMCHHCGHHEPVPEQCPACGDGHSLVPCGPGIERLAEEAQARFEGAEICVLSSDISRGVSLHEKISDIAKGKYNLIIGTQLVAKGHHFPGLTLAGVVDADLALETSDPRAGERTWQLLAQVAGRAGRGEKPGRALVQTYMPDHPLLEALAAGDREAFLSHEKQIRQAAGLPPYGLLAGIIISGGDQFQTENFARELAQRVPRSDVVQVLGPAPAPLAQIRGRFRYRFLVKTNRDQDIQAFISLWLKDLQPRGNLRVSVDIDPYSFL